MNEIQAIWLSQDDGGDVFYDVVGKNDITRIERVEYSPEPFCTKFYFKVFKGDVLCWERHKVTTVSYTK